MICFFLCYLSPFHFFLTISSPSTIFVRVRSNMSFLHVYVCVFVPSIHYCLCLFKSSPSYLLNLFLFASYLPFLFCLVSSVHPFFNFYSPTFFFLSFSYFFVYLFLFNLHMDLIIQLFLYLIVFFYLIHIMSFPYYQLSFLNILDIFLLTFYIFYNMLY